MKRYLLLLFLMSCAPHPMDPTVGDAVPVVDIETETPEYNRTDWGRWRDDDKDCQDTRQEVLAAESLDPVTYDERGCKVLSGRWKCPLSGNVYTNPRDLDIDHMVPLRAAHMAGGWDWERDTKRAYFNDLEFDNHLIATSASANRSKGARSPLEWMPPNTAFHCEYLRSWMQVKAKWKLGVGCDEAGGIAMMMAQTCGDIEVPPAP